MTSKDTNDAALRLLFEMEVDADLAESVAYSAEIEEGDVPDLVAFLRAAAHGYWGAIQ